MLTDFQNSFTDRFSGEFATNGYVFHHTLNMSLDYLVKYQCSKNDRAAEETEAHNHVRFNHSKISCKIFVW